VNYKILEEECSKYEQKTNKTADVLWHWGRSYYNLGIHSGEVIDIKNSLEKYKQAEKLGCDTPEFYNDFGKVWVQIERVISNKYSWWNAMTCFEKALDIEEGIFNYSQTCFLCYKHTAQEYYFNEAKKYLTDNALLGEMLLYKGKTTEDQQVLQKAADVFSQNVNLPYQEALWGEALTRIGYLSEDLAIMRDGENKILQAIKQEKENSNIWASYGECLYLLGEYFEDITFYEKALEQFQYAVDLDENNKNAWHGLNYVSVVLGVIYQNEKFLNNALANYSKGVDVDSENYRIFDEWADIYIKLAVLTNEPDYVGITVEKLEQSINMQSEDISTETLYKYGFALDFLGDIEEESRYYEKAIVALEQALDIDPEDDDVRYVLGTAFLHLGESTAEVEYFQKAIDTFQKLVTKNPEEELAWNDYGIALTSLAQLVSDSVLKTHEPYFEEAIQKLHRAVNLGYTRAYYNLACVYSLCGNQTEAMSYIEKAAEYEDGLPPITEMEHDEWITELWHTQQLQDFLEKTKL
jgi:tetratricopeptide (TPR) repeat protein